MCSKLRHLEILYPYLLAKDTIKTSHCDQLYNNQRRSRSCIRVAFCKAREAQAELKILNLLIRSTGLTGESESETNIQTAPTDAEIVFGNCNCEKLLCKQRLSKCGWDNSRIKWLWDLERRQHQSHYAWQEQQQTLPDRHSIRSASSLRIIEEDYSEEVESETNIGCWSWLRHRCGFYHYSGSDETLDIPYRRHSTV